MPRIAVAVLMCVLAGEVRASPFIRASSDVGIARVDVGDGDGGASAETGLAARAAAVAMPMPQLELGLRLGIAFMSTEEAATRRYANPVLDVALVRDIDRFHLRGGWSVALPLADVRVMYGTRFNQDAAALDAAARIWGSWDAWQWAPGWATIVAPLAASFAASARVVVKAELTPGLSFATGERIVNDDLTIRIVQAALGAEVDVGAGVWLGGRLLGVAIFAPDRTPVFPESSYGYSDERDGAIEVGGGVRFTSFAVSALAAVAFDGAGSPGISLGVTTWR